MKRTRKPSATERARAEAIASFNGIKRKPVPLNSILPPPGQALREEDGPGVSDGRVFFNSLRHALGEDHNS